MTCFKDAQDRRIRKRNGGSRLLGSGRTISGRNERAEYSERRKRKNLKVSRNSMRISRPCWRWDMKENDESLIPEIQEELDQFTERFEAMRIKTLLCR